jgi:hypothetical protein
MEIEQLNPEQAQKLGMLLAQISQENQRQEAKVPGTRDLLNKRSNIIGRARNGVGSLRV